jgi:hypothetical protein
MMRRDFLKGAGAAASIPLAASVRTWPAISSNRIDIPSQIKSFDIDFNWLYDSTTKRSQFAPPGHWADADPEEHIRWYESLGANVVQTFAVSCNGYAWYKHGFVPPQPGLKHDFHSDIVRLGHKRGILVMGYFCVGANSKWGEDHPDLSYGAPSTTYIPFTDRYLDYLCLSMEDAIRKTDIDGYMIDWVWNPSSKLRDAGWLPAEQKLFEQLTGKPFPKGGRPDYGEKLEYEREAIERCWARIKETRDRVNPRCVIWLSCGNFTNPTIAGSKMLREVDWSMNESPDPKYFLTGQQMAGPHTRMIQNVVGWPSHDAERFLAKPGNRALDLYGFATPRPTSLLPPIEYYLNKSLACFTGTDGQSINDKNIAALARAYRGMPLSSEETNCK